MAPFPAIKPTARSYEPGDYPIQRYRTLSGAVWKRSFGNKRVGASLSLEFANISDDEAAQILAHYDEQGGTFYRFVIPTVLLAGSSAKLQTVLALPPNLLWAYESGVSVKAVFPGVSTVSVRLIGEVRNG